MSETRERARALLAAAMDGSTFEFSARGANAGALAALFGAAPELLAALIAEADESDDLYRSVKARLGQTPGDGQMPHTAIDALERRAVEAEAERDALRAENKRLAVNIETAVSTGQRALDALEADDDMLCEDRADAFQTACEQMIAALSGSGAVIVEGE